MPSSPADEETRGRGNVLPSPGDLFRGAAPPPPTAEPVTGRRLRVLSQPICPAEAESGRDRLTQGTGWRCQGGWLGRLDLCPRLFPASLRGLSPSVTSAADLGCFPQELMGPV